MALGCFRGCFLGIQGSFGVHLPQVYDLFRFCLRSLFNVVCVFLQGRIEIYSRLAVRVEVFWGCIYICIYIYKTDSFFYSKVGLECGFRV